VGTGGGRLQLDGWDAYRDVARLGRKTRISEPKRKVLRSIFERVRAGLKAREVITCAEVFSSLAAAIYKTKKPVFDFAVIDEAQDITISNVRFFAVLGGGRRDALFFAGNLGQRIFQRPFSWKALGVDIRGSFAEIARELPFIHQIPTQVDRPLGAVVTDVIGTARIRATPSPWPPGHGSIHLKPRTRKTRLSARRAGGRTLFSSPQNFGKRSFFAPNIAHDHLNATPGGYGGCPDRGGDGRGRRATKAYRVQNSCAVRSRP
jgi:hypothetical protein